MGFIISIMLTRPFFELTLNFAEKMSRLTRQPLEESLLDWTNCYMAFGLGYSHDNQNPIWQAFLAGLERADDRAAWIHHFYQGNYRPRPQPQNAFGCFSYELWEGGRVRLHFRDAEAPQYHPLGRDRVPARLAELKALFADLRVRAPQSRNLVGGSWLYNIAAYRRLFPPDYLASAILSPDPGCRYLRIWGQFLQRDGSLRTDLAEHFRNCLEKKNTPADTLKCFPFEVLQLEAPLEVFYLHYGV